jgi:hypothetical protein
VIRSDILPTSGLTATSDRRRRQIELPVIVTQIPGCVDPVGDGESGLLVSVCEAPAATKSWNTLAPGPRFDIQNV